MASQLMGDAAFALLSKYPSEREATGLSADANLYSLRLGRASEDTDPDGTRAATCPPSRESSTTR